MRKLALKKQYKHLYQPSAKQFSVVDVPPLNFLMIDGTGDPNTSADFQAATEALYSLSYTLKFGVIKVCRFAPAHSAELPEYIAAEMRGQEAAIRKQAAAVLAPWHGLFVLGKDLESAYDTAERIDVNAHCILMSRLLPGEPVDPQAIYAQLKEGTRKKDEG